LEDQKVRRCEKIEDKKVRRWEKIEDQKIGRSEGKRKELCNLKKDRRLIG